MTLVPSKKKSFLWYVYPPFLLIVITSLVAMNLYAGDTFRTLLINQLIDDLELSATVIGSQLKDREVSESHLLFEDFVKTISPFKGRRLTIIAADGVVHADSHEELSAMDNHRDRPEIATAFRGGRGHSERFSSTLQEQLLYVAVPVIVGDTIPAVVRMAVPLTFIDDQLSSLNQRILVTGCLVTLLAGLLSLWLTRRVSSRIQEIQLGAERFAKGHLSFRLDVPQSHELSRLAGAMNSMAGQLDDRIKTIIAQRNQLDAVLSGMSEAVVAFNLDEQILFLNSAAENLFNVEQWKVAGKTITETIRNSEFQELVSELVNTRESSRGDIHAGVDRNRLLEVHGNVLHDESGDAIGGLLVLNDVTELRRLETIRKDFVANVSHELRTPITSIKGFVETLLENIDKDDFKENAARFLPIVLRHADRLNKIIEDLLSLSRIEQQSNSLSIETETIKISEVVDGAINLCEQNARAKNISIERSCREELRGQASPSLLEQALVNLIDNAIKYSEEKSEVKVEVREENDEIILAVHDNGCGIPREHLERLFERFYRVDKARSRKVGGTGLGLSIVKHISHALGGYPTVSSVVGSGSTFSIHLPRGARTKAVQDVS